MDRHGDERRVLDIVALGRGQRPDSRRRCRRGRHVVGGAWLPIGVSVSCPLGDLAAGAATTVTVTGTVTPDFVGGPLANAATATAGTPDPDPTDDRSTASGPVSTSADVRITKSGPDSATPGNTITWQLTVDNDGPSVAQAVVVTDVLPTDLVGARASFSAACSLHDRLGGGGVRHRRRAGRRRDVGHEPGRNSDGDDRPRLRVPRC